MHSVATQCRPINVILQSKSLQQICKRSNTVSLSIVQVNSMISLGGRYGPRPSFIFFREKGVMAAVCVCTCNSLLLYNKLLQGKNKSYMVTHRGCTFKSTYKVKSLTHSFTQLEKACSSCPRVFEASQHVGEDSSVATEG